MFYLKLSKIDPLILKTTTEIQTLEEPQVAGLETTIAGFQSERCGFKPQPGGKTCCPSLFQDQEDPVTLSVSLSVKLCAGQQRQVTHLFFGGFLVINVNNSGIGAQLRFEQIWTEQCWLLVLFLLVSSQGFHLTWEEGF